MDRTLKRFLRIQSKLVIVEWRMEDPVPLEEMRRSAQSRKWVHGLESIATTLTGQIF